MNIKDVPKIGIDSIFPSKLLIMISLINKCQITNQRMYIVDRHRISYFSMQGKEEGRGPKLEQYAYKLREIVAMFGWLASLYLVCVLSQSA